MRIVKKQLVLISVLCIFNLMGCDKKETKKETSATTYEVTKEPTESNDVSESKDYSEELSQMGDLLYYMAYATAFSDDKFVDDTLSLNQMVTLDEQIVWDSVYIAINSQDFEDYDYEEYEDEKIKVELTKEEVKLLRTEGFLMNDDFDFKDEYCSVGTVEEVESKYVFYLGDLQDNKAYFEIDQIVPIGDNEKEFSLQVRLMKGTTDNVNQIAIGEVVVKKNENAKMFKYAIKSMNLEPIMQNSQEK